MTKLILWQNLKLDKFFGKNNMTTQQGDELYSQGNLLQSRTIASEYCVIRGSAYEQ